MSEMQKEKDLIKNFLHQCTLEVTPGGAIKIDDFGEVLRAGTTVYVTFLAGSDFNDTVETAIRLCREGMNPVPHIVARATPSKTFLEEKLKILQAEAKVDEVLIIAGGISQPVGEFDRSIQMLETDLFQKYGIRKIGIAGHPEGSADIPPEELRKALLEKSAYASKNEVDMYIATQFCFEAAPVIEWDKRIREEGNELPIHLGIPGLATIKTLIGHAKACGVGASMRVLTRQAGNIAKLMTTRMPDKLIRDIAVYSAHNTDCGIKQCHMYPLGGLKKSADWMYAVQHGDFELGDKNGFKVFADLKNQ